jgi:replicative DNA helicase
VNIDDKTRDAERQVLGACITDADALDDVLAVISSADLWDPRHQRILEACEFVTKAGTHLEVLTVASALGDDLGRAGGMAYLHELVGSVVTVSSAGWSAEQVIRPASIERAVRLVGQRFMDMAPGVDALDLVNAARAELDQLALGHVAETTHEQDVYAALEVALDPDTGGVPTPWRDLTEATGGWHPGTLTIVGARPAVGKSVIGVGAAMDMARRDRVAHLASLEMSRTELYHRMLASVGSVDSARIIHRKLTNRDHEQLAAAAAHIARLPLSVDDSTTQRVSDIRAKARAIARTRPLGLIVVDYLQLMRSGQRVESRQAEVSAFSRDLKLMAKELQVPVIALSQLNRGSEHRADKMPAMSDLRESGAIEQDADAVILLHRDPDEPDYMQMLLAKNRHGPADQLIRLHWEGAYSRVSDHYPTNAQPIHERHAS